jgi:hypothetical protein
MVDMQEPRAFFFCLNFHDSTQQGIDIHVSQHGVSAGPAKLHHNFDPKNQKWRLFAL